jgi:hypothetical protein
MSWPSELVKLLADMTVEEYQAKLEKEGKDDSDG